MRLKSKTESAMAALGTFQNMPQAVHIVDDKRQLDCQLTSLESLGCEFDELTLASDELRDATMDELKQISQQLSNRITYLLEAICAVEIDPQHAIVQLRSVPPQTGDDGTTYYELMVTRGGTLSLCRYQKQPGGVRQVIPARVTREVLLRLVDDFEAVLSAR